MICREARAESLLAALALHEIDLVLADTPVPPTVHVKAYSHLLGESDVTCFAARPLRPGCAAGSRTRRPGRDAAAGEGTVVRRQLDDWFQATGIRPAIVGEFDDSALMKAFGEQGAGAFVGPTAIAAEFRASIAWCRSAASTPSASASTPSPTSGGSSTRPWWRLRKPHAPAC